MSDWWVKSSPKLAEAGMERVMGRFALMNHFSLTKSQLCPGWAHCTGSQFIKKAAVDAGRC